MLATHGLPVSFGLWLTLGRTDGSGLAVGSRPAMEELRSTLYQGARIGLRGRWRMGQSRVALS